MTMVMGFAIYAIVWWMVLFTVLPFGNRPPDIVEPGHAESAPEKPRVWIKMGVTTLISTAIWGGIYWVMGTDLISFRD